MLSTVFFLFTSMLFACGKGIIKLDDSKVDRNQLGKLRNEIVSLVQEEGEIYNCRAVAFGAKPCGGPWEYLVYSDTATEEETLLNKVANYNRLEHDLNIREQTTSDCIYIQEPKLALVEGKCVSESENIETEFRRNDLNLLPLTEMENSPSYSAPLKVIDTAVFGDTLAMQISYTGGCRPHYFQLVDTGIATRSIPPQHLLRLFHISSDDPCEAQLTRVLFFNLVTLKSLYQNLGSVALRIEGVDGMPMYSWE